MTLISRKRHFKPSEITNNSSSGTVKETQLIFYCLNKLRVVVNGAFLPLKRSKTRRRKWHVEPSWSSEVNQDEQSARVKHHWVIFSASERAWKHLGYSGVCTRFPINSAKQGKRRPVTGCVKARCIVLQMLVSFHAGHVEAPSWRPPARLPGCQPTRVKVSRNSLSRQPAEPRLLLPEKVTTLKEGALRRVHRNIWGGGASNAPRCKKRKRN